MKTQKYDAIATLCRAGIAALYILRPGDVPTGEPAECYYSRGLPVY